MAYTSFEYDIFISYAHADDVADASGKGWVAQFQEALRKLLPQRLLGNTPVIFFDHAEVASNHQLSKLRTAARNSAIFLAIVSPTYAARPWTREELAAFTGGNDWNDADATRLFAVECLEPDDRQAYPTPLDTHLATPFWETHDQLAMPLRPSQEQYSIKLTKVANDIAKKLKQIREAAAQTAATAAAARPAASGPTVLLAQTTDDLEEASEQLRSYLGQFKIPALPAEPYPQGGDAFRAAFTQDLARASLYVQLLGGSPGRRPPDMPEGYTAYQAATARAKAVPIMQWRSPELKLDAVANAEHRLLLGGEHVIVDSLEGFKAAVVRQASKPPQTAGPPPASNLVFIDAALDDLELARQIQSELTQPSALPELSGPPEAVLADLEDNIVDCSVLVLVNGRTTPLWVRAQLRLYTKLRGKRAAPPRVLEVVVEPPENKEHGMRFEELRRVRVRGALDQGLLDKAALRPVLEALGG